MVKRYQHPIFALQYELSEGRGAHLDDIDTYVAAMSRIDGPVLELGAGTGRLTLPLAASGARVVALDIGRPMLNLLVARDRDAALPVCGDMTTLPFRPGFASALCGYNSLSCLLEREAILRCFKEVHRVLAPGGHFRFDIAVFRPEDIRENPKEFDWETWTTDDGRAIRRRIRLAYSAEHERIDYVYTYRWRDETEGPREEAVEFALNMFPVEDVLAIGEDAGFSVIATEWKTFPGRHGHERMWLFAALKRPST